MKQTQVGIITIGILLLTIVALAILSGVMAFIQLDSLNLHGVRIV